MIVAQAVVNVLKEQNAKVIYGIPGGQTLFFTNALIDTHIQFIQTRHEGAAAAAADAWGRLTCKPGMCLATTGPGATNLITALGGALRDSSPVIAFLFQNKLADAGRGDAQDSNHEELFKSIVKAYIPVRHPDSAVWAMREAYRMAMTGKPGPVVVDFYRDVIESTAECEYSPVPVEQYCPAMDVIPSSEAMNKAVQLLSQHKHVCIWSGNGVKMSSAGSLVTQLAEKLSTPIVTTFNGIGSVPSGHPLVFGPRSRHGSSLTRQILEDADCVLVLGSSLSGISTNRWSLNLKNIIQIDFDSSQIGRQYPVSCGIIGEITKTLSFMLDMVRRSHTQARKAWIEELFEKQKKWQSSVFSGPINDSGATPAAPVAVMRELNTLLRPGQIVCVDAGNPGAWSHLLQLDKGMTYMKPVNFGNMGFAVPAGIACSMAEPEREVISILGDGSLGMTLGDLDTAARCGHKLIVIVFNDNAFGNIKQEELYKFGADHYIGVDLSGISYAQLAKDMGMKAETVRKASDLQAAFGNARRESKPYLIEVLFDGSYSIWPEAF